MFNFLNIFFSFNFSFHLPKENFDYKDSKIQAIVDYSVSCCCKEQCKEHFSVSIHFSFDQFYDNTLKENLIESNSSSEVFKSSWKTELHR